MSNLVNELDSVLTDTYYDDSSIVYGLAETLYRLEYNEINTSIQRDQPIQKFKYDELLKFTEQIQQQAEQYGFQ